MCTLLLRAAQGSFFKNNNLTSFHPLLLKPSCFLRLPLLPLFLSPPLLLLLLLLSHLCHVLVFIRWFFSPSFSPCVKKYERLKIGWVRGEERQEWKSAAVSRWTNSFFFLLFLFSAPAVTDYNGSPKTPSIYITVCSGELMTVLNECIPMRYSPSMTRGTAVISHRQPHKNSL